MKHLENENKRLETQLRILQEPEVYKGKIDQVLQEMEADLLRQVESLTRDRLKLGAELDKCQEEVEDSKQKWVAGHPIKFKSNFLFKLLNQTFKSNLQIKL